MAYSPSNWLTFEIGFFFIMGFSGGSLGLLDGDIVLTLLPMEYLATPDGTNGHRME
jgi:hypothetical protein